MAQHPIFNTDVMKWLLPLFVAGAALLAPGPAHAVHCEITNTPMQLSFGNVGVAGSTGASGQFQVNYTCTSYSLARNFQLCVTAPTGDDIGNYTNPQMLLAGDFNAPRLQYALYTDAAHGQLWSPSNFVVSTPISMGSSVNGNPVVNSGQLAVYAHIPGGQTTLAPGNYAANLYGINLGFVTGSSCQSSTGDLNASTGASIHASATVINACTVSATDVDFGAVAPDATNLSATGALRVYCPNGTPYNIGLAPSNGSSSGAGVMNSSAPNSGTVPYQLRSTTGASGTVWGNTATASSPGNGVSGVGSGSTQSVPVYVTVPDAAYTPGTYSDKVTVQVHY